MDFFIKQNNTLPEIKYSLTKEIVEKYNIDDELMNNAVVTFSMIDNDSGKYIISNAPAEIKITDGNFESKYILVFKLKEKHTKKIGFYSGKFNLDFLS